MNLWWAASIVAEAVLALRLVSLGLESRFPWFVAMLLVGVGRSLILLQFRPGTTAYGVSWAISAPVLMFFQAACVLELFRRTCAHYCGIGAFARWLLLGSLGVGAILAALTLQPDLARRPGELALAYLVIGQRYLATTLALGAVAFRLFFLYFPAPLRSNVKWHSVILTGYLLTVAAAYYSFPLNPELSSTILMAAEICCLVAWGILLNSAGEKAPQPEQTGRTVEEVDRRLLEAIAGAESVLSKR